MKFAYEDLNDDQFEELIVLVCQRQSFARAHVTVNH